VICQICKKNPANIIFTIIINNKKKDINICKKCAEEKGFSNPLGEFPSLLGGIIFGMAEEKIKEIMDDEILQKDITCEECGLRYAEFKTSGLLGCQFCYEAFKDDLKVILRRIHGNNRHFALKKEGILPEEKEISELRRELEKAIEKEEFEKAAQIRDKIKYIKKNAK